MREDARRGGENLQMKKLLLGIAIILFAGAVELSFDGHFAYITAGIAAIGLAIAVVGYFREDK